MKRSTALGAVVLAALLVFGVAAPSLASSSSLRAESAASDHAPIVVGGQGSLEVSPGISGGFEAGIYRFNKAGGLDGRKIKYVGFLDDGFSPSTASTQVHQLVENDHVFAVSPWNDFVAGTDVTGFLAQSHTPLIGFCNCPVADQGKWTYGMNGNPSLDNWARSDSFTQMAHILGLKESQMKWAVAEENVGAALPILQGAEVALKAIGAKVVYAQASIAPNATDFAPYAQTLIASGANVIFLGLAAPLAIGLTAALKAAGYTGATLNGQTYYPGQLGTLPSEEAALQGAYVNDEFPVDQDNTPAVRQALKDLKSVGAPPHLTFGTSIGYWSAQLLISMLKATLAKVGSASKVTPTALQKTVNAGYTYKSALAGGLAPETFPKAELQTTACSSTVQVKGSGYVLAAPYSCSKLYPISS